MKVGRPVNLISALATVVSCSLAMLLSDGAASSQELAAPSSLLLFVGQVQPNRTTIYNAQNQPIAVIPVGDGVSAFDRQGDFYVSPSDGHTLLIIAPPYKHVSARISFSAVIFSVAVDQRSDVFAVSLYDGSDGEVQFFRHGYLGPCNTVIAKGAGVLGTGSAFDEEGNLFIQENENDGNETVASIAGKCHATELKTYQFPFPVEPEYPFTFTAQDNLVFQNNYSGSHYGILTFAHPTKGRFAQPLTKTKLVPPAPASDMRLNCLTSDGKHLWAIPLPLNENTKTLVEYLYPQGGRAVAAINLLHPYACRAYPLIVP